MPIEVSAPKLVAVLDRLTLALPAPWGDGDRAE